MRKSTIPVAVVLAASVAPVQAQERRCCQHYSAGVVDEMR